jgi:hypothetical protein
MNLQENVRKVLKEELNEVRVPRRERVELYKDNNIIVVVPLTHRALQKYAHQCQWCINDDIHEWEDYHKGKHAVIIQRNPKKPKIGITGNPTASEIFLLAKWDNNQSSFEDVCQMLDYEFRNDRTMSDYYVTISNDMNNFATNIVYYSPKTGIYDQEDNFLWNFNIEINDIPNVKPKVIEIMDDYLQENEEMSLQESIKRTLNEESLKQTLKDQVKEFGYEEIAKYVGGSENLAKLAFNNDPFEYLNTIKETFNFVQNDIKGWTLIKDNNGNTLIVYVPNIQSVFVNNHLVWRFIWIGFNLIYEEVQDVITKWFEDEYKTSVTVSSGNSAQTQFWGR